MDAAVGASRLLTRWTPHRLIDAFAAATCLAAVVADGTAGVSAWHLTCLAALVGVVLLFRRQRLGQRHGGLEAAVTVVVAAQPTLHLVGEVWHRSAGGHDPTRGAAHVGLLGLYLTLGAALFAVLVLADVLVLALADAVEQVVRLVAALGRRRPEVGVVARLRPTGHLVAGRTRPTVADAPRRGPPRALSFA